MRELDQLPGSSMRCALLIPHAPFGAAEGSSASRRAITAPFMVYSVPMMEAGAFSTHLARLTNLLDNSLGSLSASRM